MRCENITQPERLQFLADRFKEDSVQYRNERAARIAIQTVTQWLASHEGQMERVIFNVFKDEDKAYYEKLLCYTC